MKKTFTLLKKPIPISEQIGARSRAKNIPLAAWVTKRDPFPQELLFLIKLPRIKTL